METEEQRSIVMRLGDQLEHDKTTIAGLKAENRYLAKRFVAFMILRSWAATRKRAFEQEVIRNKAKIALQEASMAQRTARIDGLLVLKQEMEQDIAANKEKLKQKDLEI